MPIQIEQKFPRCRRCGKMIHFRGARIEAPTANEEGVVVLCSETCRDEYAQLFGLEGPGEWRRDDTAGRRL